MRIKLSIKVTFILAFLGTHLQQAYSQAKDYTDYKYVANPCESYVHTPVFVESIDTIEVAYKPSYVISGMDVHMTGDSIGLDTIRLTRLYWLDPVDKCTKIYAPGIQFKEYKSERKGSNLYHGWKLNRN